MSSQPTSTAPVSAAQSNQTAPDPATISQVAQQEGGTTKGSTSAQMQSDLTKQSNADQVDSHVADKLATGQSITKQEANLAESRESRAMGGQRPPPGSVAAQAQSAAQKDANLQQAASDVKAKLDNAPQTITPADGNKLHSAETKAKGATEKGGLASQAQSQAAANQGATKSSK